MSVSEFPPAGSNNGQVKQAHDAAELPTSDPKDCESVTAEIVSPYHRDKEDETERGAEAQKIEEFAMCALRHPMLLQETFRVLRFGTPEIARFQTKEDLTLRVAYDLVRKLGPSVVEGPGWRSMLEAETKKCLYNDAPRMVPYKQMACALFEKTSFPTRSFFERCFGPEPPFPVEHGRMLLREIQFRYTVLEPLLWQLQLRGAGDDDVLARSAIMKAAQGLAQAEGESRQGFKGQPVDAAQLLVTPTQRVQLVKHFLVAGKPAVIGGPLKGMKTSVLADLAVSLSTGTRFLGHFEVPEAKRVLLVSGESGDDDIKDLIRRVSRAHHVCLSTGQLFLEFDLPQLASSTDLLLLDQAVRQHMVEVVLLDPVYLMLAAGDSRRRLDHNNMFEMGSLLLQAARTCLAAGATPVFCHHVTKAATQARGADHEPMALQDLAHAGLAQAARQWCLLSYQTPYNPLTGKCVLWLNVGGSSGQGGLYTAAVDQGVADDKLEGRHWKVTVQAGRQALDAVAKAKEEAKATQKRDQDCKHRKAVCDFLTTRPQGALQTEIADAVPGLNKNNAGPPLQAMLQDLEVVRCCLPGDKASYKRWRLAPAARPSNIYTDEVVARLKQGTPIDEVLRTDHAAAGRAGPGGNTA